MTPYYDSVYKPFRQIFGESLESCFEVGVSRVSDNPEDKMY